MTEPTREAAPARPASRDVRVPATRTLTPELERVSTVGAWLAAVEGGDPTNARARAAAAYRVWVAEQLDLGPAAAGDLYVIDNRVSISAQLLRALAEREGYRIECVELTDESCTARIATSDGQTLGSYTFTLDDAERAGLTGKRNWKTYPRRMLWARASTYAIRDFAPGVALGLRTTEEMGGERDDEEPTPPSAYDEPVESTPHPEPVEDAEWQDVTPEELGDLAHEGEQATLANEP